MAGYPQRACIDVQRDLDCAEWTAVFSIPKGLRQQFVEAMARRGIVSLRDHDQPVEIEIFREFFQSRRDLFRRAQLSPCGAASRQHARVVQHLVPGAYQISVNYLFGWSSIWKVALG